MVFNPSVFYSLMDDLAFLICRVVFKCNVFYFTMGELACGLTDSVVSNSIEIFFTAYVVFQQTLKMSEGSS